MRKSSIFAVSFVAGSSIFSPVVFEGSEATNMTAHFGSTAMLGCKIRNNVEDNPVSKTEDSSGPAAYCAVVYTA